MSSTNRIPEQQNRPWQVDWKRPQWCTIESRTTTAVRNGRQVDHTAALVYASEAFERLSLPNTKGEQELVYSATLVSSNDSEIADVVLLDLLQQHESSSKSDDTLGQNGCESVLSRLLRWPEQLANPQAGLVAAAFCRKSPRNPAVDLADALDVVQLVALDQASTETDSNSRMQADHSQSTDESMIEELLLCLISTDGIVHFYSALELFRKPHASVSMEDALAAMLLGDSYATIQDTFLPLTQPIQSSFISVASPRKASSEQQYNEKIDERVLSMWDISLWDPVVDPSTAAYATKRSRPTSALAAFEYVCVLGRGHLKRGRRPQGEMSDEISKFSSVVTSSTMFGGEEDGGFLTFFSLQTFSETRVLYLPFAPLRMSLVTWGGMTFVLVIGDFQHLAVLVRIDACDNEPVPKGSPPSLFRKSSKIVRDDDLILLRRFQMLPIMLPHLGEPAILFGATQPTTPPSLAFTCADDDHITVSLYTMVSLDWISTGELDSSYNRMSRDDRKIVVVKIQHNPSHIAQIQVSDAALSNVQYQGGQGWALVLDGKYAHFVCWEGSTLARGTFVVEVGTSQAGNASLCGILPVKPFDLVQKSVHDFLSLPFSEALEAPKLNRQESETTQDSSSELDKVVAEALDSISSQSYRDNVISRSSPQSPRRKSFAFTNREKSLRLLRQCSSWVQLEQVKIQSHHFEQQYPVVSYRNIKPDSSGILSLRRKFVENGTATPFQQVLAWLSSKEDFFTAASLALGLIHDTHCLSHLWRAFGKIKEDRSELEGLLDGVISINEKANETPPATLTQLADMTVGCLTKGGFAMSSTLQEFLKSDSHYDPARASLMLVAIAAIAVSEEEDSILSIMGKDYERDDMHDENILWPVRCLMQIGVSRKNLLMPLLLLNATIPDELRRRNRASLAVPSLPSMSLCKNLITIIVDSSPEAARTLMSIVDEQSRLPFWESLSPDTRLELALVQIKDCYPMILEKPVRLWAQELLDGSLREKDDFDSSQPPTQWLQNIVKALLKNAAIDFDVLFTEAAKIATDKSSDHNGVDEYIFNIRALRNALNASEKSGELDFSLLIPALLVLRFRDAPWNSDANVSTQSMLNATCYLAGRQNSASSFMLDSLSLMRDCTLAGNVQAGGNLIGGKDGVTLECCDLLISTTDLSMEEAEAFLVSDIHQMSSLKPTMHDSFSISDAHRHLLWLLDEHVLSIRTYGEFENAESKGKVDPVFVASLCFRSWFYLTRTDLSNGTTWLVRWLREMLEILFEAKISKHRLACAALSRVLLWPTMNVDNKEKTLGELLGIPGQFLVQLAQSCCGLVQAIPMQVAEDLPETKSEIIDNLMGFAPNRIQRVSTEGSNISSLSAE